MMLDILRLTYEQNREKQTLFVRNLLKEQLQYFVLNFIFNSQYARQMLFKGGTCLRFCFDLPRLSEDLDLDVDGFETFDFARFNREIKDYFANKLLYRDLAISVSGINKIIYLKFPLLNKIGLPVNEQKPSENTLFVRIDLAPVKGSFFTTELTLKSASDFSFFIRRYGLKDLYAGKIAAIISRKKMEGKVKMPRLKGRDFFDIWWLKEKNISWNNRYLSTISGISSESEIKKRVNAKIREAALKKSEIRPDLLPFFENPDFVENFVNNLKDLHF